MSDTLVLDIGGIKWTATGCGQAYLDTLDEIIEIIEEEAAADKMPPDEYWKKLIDSPTGIMWGLDQADKMLKKHAARLIAAYLEPDKPMSMQQRREVIERKLKRSQRREVIDHFLASSDGPLMLRDVLAAMSKAMRSRSSPETLMSLERRSKEQQERLRSLMESASENSADGD